MLRFCLVCILTVWSVVQWYCRCTLHSQQSLKDTSCFSSYISLFSSCPSRCDNLALVFAWFFCLCFSFFIPSLFSHALLVSSQTITLSSSTFLSLAVSLLFCPCLFFFLCLSCRSKASKWICQWPSKTVKWNEVHAYPRHHSLFALLLLHTC